MEMLSSATKMDIFPTFLQSERDFDEDFNYITSSGTTLGEMLSTENFLESYGYESKSPDDIFADDVVYDTNDFVAIIKQEPGFEYHDYQMNTSPESEMSSYEDQLQLIDTSSDLMSVDLEYLRNHQDAAPVKQENVVVKVEAVDSDRLTDESVPIISHEVSAELSTNNGLQYLFEGGIVKAEKEFDWKAGFEDIDCVVPSLFMDGPSGHHASQFVIKGDPAVKSEINVKREDPGMPKSLNLNEPFRNTSTEEFTVDEIVRRNQTDTANRMKNSDSKRSAPEILGKSNKKQKKLGDNEDGDERLKKAVNNVKLRQQKKFEEGRLREQKRRDEEFQKKARERAQYFSKQIASGALQLKPVEEKDEKKRGCLQKKRGRKPKAGSSPDRSASVNVIPVATSSSCKVNSSSDLCSTRSSKGTALQLNAQPSSASSVVSSTSQQMKSIDSSLSKRSPKVNTVLVSSAVTSTLCLMKETNAVSVKMSPSQLSLPSESSASSQVKSLGIFPSKKSPNGNDASLTASSSLPVSYASCLKTKTDASIHSNSAGTAVQFANCAVIPAKVNTSNTGDRGGKMSSILSTSNMRPQLPLAVSTARGGISILKSTHASLAAGNSSSKTVNASFADTRVTYAAKAQTSLLRPSQMAGTSVLRAPPPAQLQNVLPNDVSSVRLHQRKSPGVQSSKVGSMSPAVVQNSRLVASLGQKPWTGANKMPVVTSAGHTSPPDLVASETAAEMIERSAVFQSVAEDEASEISKHEPESKLCLPADTEADRMDDDDHCYQASTAAAAVVLTHSVQDDNNNEKKKEKKRRLNLSEYMNRLKERSKNESREETKPQVTSESLETSDEMRPRTTNECLSSDYSVLAEHNYCIRPKQPSNDLPSDRSSASESGKMMITMSDGTVLHLKARSSAPALATIASPDGVSCSLPSNGSTFSASKVQSVDEQISSSHPVPSVTGTNDHGSMQPRNSVNLNSHSSPGLAVNGKISSDYVSSKPRIAFSHNQNVASSVHSTISSSKMANCASDHAKAPNNNGKVSCASNSTSARQWKLIPHNLQVTLVSFRNAIGQKTISSNNHHSSQLENVNLNHVESAHVPSVTSCDGNVGPMLDHESSRPSKVLGSSQVVLKEEFNSDQPFSDASGCQSIVSASSENSNQSCIVASSVPDSLPSHQSPFSSSDLTSVSAEEKTPTNHCALSSAPSASGSANRDSIRRRSRTSRNWRHSQSSRSSRSSSSDSCRSRSPIRQHRQSRDGSSSSSYCSRSPSRQRNHRDYRRSNRYNWQEKKWRSDDFTLDEKDKVREKKIYVGGIPDDCTPLDLKERFKHFGDITKVSVHPQTEQENYGFLTFRYTKDALRVKEEGHKVAGCENFHFCYGDRRSFCKEDYKDFDNMWSQSWDDDVGYHVKPKQSEGSAFEDMLKAHLRDQRRKNH